MAGVLASNALVFPAITLYLGNADRFDVPLLPALSLVLLFAVSLFIVVFLVLGRVSHKRQRAAAAGFAVLSVLVWVQGSFLVWDYGSLDGRGINWREFQLISLVDIAVWLALSILLILLARKRQGLVVKMAGLLFALQLATSVGCRVTSCCHSNRTCADGNVYWIMNRLLAISIAVTAVSTKTRVLSLHMESFPR